MESSYRLVPSLSGNLKQASRKGLISVVCGQKGVELHVTVSEMQATIDLPQAMQTVTGNAVSYRDAQLAHVYTIST